MQEHLHRVDQLIHTAASHLRGDLDGEQIELYELAFCKAEISAAIAMQTHANQSNDRLAQSMSQMFAAEALINVNQRLAQTADSLGLGAAEIDSVINLSGAKVSEHLSPRRLAELGERVIEQFAAKGAVLSDTGLDEEKRLMRDTFRQFADQVVKPRAAAIHREDNMVPPEILRPLAEMGCFGLSVPQRFGGLKPDDNEDSVGMVVVTEELSRGSLGAAGSLITRPEIMARALLEGGTQTQQQRWLPHLASGELLCAISVTEPDAGSDVAGIALQARKTKGGWLLSGGKTWCTFAGKAGAILVLARTNKEIQPPHKGLSLFVIEKDSTDDHEINIVQSAGGKLSGRAIPTIGYRGMHSFEMFYDDFFVADDQLVGEESGIGRGFYYTMRGFMGGRIQTAARACGLMQSAFEQALAYAEQRKVFGKPLSQYPITQAKLAKMATYIAVCQQFSYAVARLMDQDQGAMEASLVKLYACKVCEWVCREALQIHGGMGYAEETEVSRLFVDARVLSIFEGAEETLAVRVIGKTLCSKGTN